MTQKIAPTLTWEENALLKQQQLNQDEQCQNDISRSSDGARPKRDH